MKEISSAVQDIQSAFEKNQYPNEFLAAYDQVECLANHYGRETFIVQKKDGDELYVAKCYDLTTFSFSSGIDLTKDFNHKGLPRYIEQFQNDKMLCVIREHIDGIPLNKLTSERPISFKEIIDICTKLSDIIIYLHEHQPPIVHRDIKPANIIVQPDGNVVLIDFDIARMVRDGADEDTVFWGTRGFAPPEQYGFSQTDGRADIYSFGTLLRFLLTGSIRENNNITINHGLQTIIDRCTAFSPKERFKDMRSVKKALQSVKERPGITPRQIASGVIIALAFFVIGFLIGRNTILFSAPEHGVSFSESLFEAAVREQLGVSENVILTDENLSEVRRLYIYGTSVFKEPDQFYEQVIDDSVRGQLRTLDDIRLLPNLEELHIVNQGDIDISALSTAKNLYALEIKHTPISDCSSIATLKQLKHICLFDTDISDFTGLENCALLESLDVGLTPVRSMDQIGEYPWVESLTLMWLRMKSLDGLEKMTKLKAVSLQFSEIDDMSALLNLPELEVVYAGRDNIEQVEELLRDTNVSVELGE